MTNEMASISNTIRLVEQEMRSQDIQFLTVDIQLDVHNLILQLQPETYIQLGKRRFFSPSMFDSKIEEILPIVSCQKEQDTITVW